MNKKKIFFLFILFILLSCNNKSYEEEYYADGTLKSKVEVNNYGVANGLYEEYYKNGTVKLRSKYTDGIIEDTVYVYHENGKIKERGILIDSLKTGWWYYHDSFGDLTNKKEYKVVDDNVFENQVIYYDKEGSVIEEKSSFFTIDLPDTVTIGKNIGKMKYNSVGNDDAYEKFVYVIVENQYSDKETKRDTFTNNIEDLWFGVFANKAGQKVVKGTIEEELLYLNEINKDSSELIIKRNRKYFEKEIYVKDTVTNSF